MLSILLPACAFNWPTSACDGIAASYGEQIRVEAAFATDVGGIRRLRGIGPEVDLFAGEPDGTPAVLCWISGPLPVGPPIGPNGEIRDSFDRAAVGVLESEHQLLFAGYADELEITAPR